MPTPTPEPIVLPPEPAPNNPASSNSTESAVPGVWGSSRAVQPRVGVPTAAEFGCGAGVGVFGYGQIGVEGVGPVGGSFTAVSNHENSGNALVVNDTNDEDALVSTSGSAHHAAVSAWNTSNASGVAPTPTAAPGGFGLWATSNNTGIYAHGTPAGYFDGDVYVTGTVTVGTDIVLTGADFAEEFDLTGGADAEPGTVMVLDGEGAVKPSSCPYDRRVAGIISGAGEYRPGLILDKRVSGRPRKALALVGKVYCKVDASYAPIESGDLLTTSPTCGHAMKAVDANWHSSRVSQCQPKDDL
jgi:hypothetical protein